MSLSINIKKKIGNFNLDVKLDSNAEVLGLLGASGAGKSLVLKCIAGIERPEDGEISLNGRILFSNDQGINLKPQKRKIGYLFQDYALFPNMTVYQNIRCILPQGNEGDDMARDLISKFGLSEIENRFPLKLSGGEKQKTALARIVASGPQMLLLDEPFAAMDSQLRFKMESELKEIIRKMNIPVIIVTHNRDEAYRMCDEIAIMQQGEISEMNTAHALFDYPRTREAAIMTGCKNIAECHRIEDYRYNIPSWGISVTSTENTDCPYVGIRMRKIRLIDSVFEGEYENLFAGRIHDIINEPFDKVLMIIPEDGNDLIGIVTDKEVPYAVGDKIVFHIPPKDIYLLTE